MTIDTHLHFWRYDPREFGWLNGPLEAIRRDWTPNDFTPPMIASGIDRIVPVAVRSSIEETRFLLAIAARYPSIVRGVIGWLPLEDDAFDAAFTELRHPKLVGVRPVLQGRPAGAFGEAAFNRGVARLADAGLALDVLLYVEQLDEIGPLADRHPNVRMILSHLAKPRIELGELEPWATQMRDLARRPNVACKITGGITERKPDWTPADVRPFLDVALDAFGPDRLIFGSNWPLSETAGGATKWTSFVREWIGDGAEREKLMGANAVKWYRLTTNDVTTG